MTFFSKSTTFIVCIGVIALLNGCQIFEPAQKDKGTLCRELKYQIVLNSTTNSSAKAWEKRSNMDKLNESYRNAGCM